MFALSENQRLYWNLQKDHVYLYDRLYVTQVLLFLWRVWFGVGLRRAQVPSISDGWLYENCNLRWDNGNGWSQSVSNGTWSPVTSVRVSCVHLQIMPIHLSLAWWGRLYIAATLNSLCSWVRTEKLWCKPKNWTVGHGNPQLTRFPKNWKPVWGAAPWLPTYQIPNSRFQW